MTTATLPIATAAGRASKAHKGFFVTLFDRLVEARTRQAEVEVRRHLDRMAPEFLEMESHKDAVGKNWSLPFVR